MAQPISPDLWQAAFPRPKPTVHKYDRGLAVILAAPELTGATALAATAALYSGVGLVRVVTPMRGDVYRTILPPDIMVTDSCDHSENKVTAWLAGPGGMTTEHRDMLTQINAPVILDSAALPEPGTQLGPHHILTPHHGEFRRVFPNLDPEETSDIRRAAEQSQAIILCKGPVTVIAHPDGRAVRQDNPNPALARGGTGDVLAGLITGLVAQGMSAFASACAAVWIHSRAAEGQGHSFGASDLLDTIRPVIDDLATR